MRSPRKIRTVNASACGGGEGAAVGSVMSARSGDKDRSSAMKSGEPVSFIAPCIASESAGIAAPLTNRIPAGRLFRMGYAGHEFFMSRGESFRAPVYCSYPSGNGYALCDGADQFPRCHRRLNYSFLHPAPHRRPPYPIDFVIHRLFKLSALGLFLALSPRRHGSASCRRPGTRPFSVGRALGPGRGRAPHEARERPHSPAGADQCLPSPARASHPGQFARPGFSFQAACLSPDGR